MVDIKVHYDHKGNTLTVWFGAPQEECVCEETGAEVVLMKDNAGRVIGFEKLIFALKRTEPFGVAFEMFSA